MNPRFSHITSLAGAIVAAMAASACCIGPLIFALLGIGGASALVAFEPYRPYLTALTLLLLGVGWFVTYKDVLTWSPPADDCGCEKPTINRMGKRVLWLSTLIVVAVLLFPFATPYLFL